MFSGDENPGRLSASQSRGIGLSAGIQLADFTYRPLGEGMGELTFNSELLALHLDLGGIEIFSHFGQGLPTPTGNDLSTFNIGANLGNVFPLLIRNKVRLLLPLTLTTDFLRVSRDRARSEFQQSSVQVASGAQVVLNAGVGRMGNGPVLAVKGEPFLGFSYSQGSLFGGSLRGVRGEVTVSGLRITSRLAIRAGYRYQFRAYNIDGLLYDYSLQGHTFLLGVGF